MLTFIEKTPREVMDELKNKFKKRRLFLRYTQEALANRSGVSHGSIKRFERSSEISLVSLLKIAAILGYLNDFEKLANYTIDTPETLKDKLKENNPQRGRKK